MRRGPVSDPKRTEDGYGTRGFPGADIAAPIRSIVRRQRNVQVLLGRVTGVDLEESFVWMDAKRVSYDWLVLAAGATHTYFGHPEWERVAPGLKTIDDALGIRRHLLLAFEEAELEEDSETRRAKLTFVVVGGGPTGVEMAGALREIASETIPDDFRRVDTTTTRVVLMEGGPRLLAGMSERAGHLALRALESMGVEVRLDTFVTRIDDESVWVGEQRLPAANVIWAAGVQGAPLVRGLGLPLDDQGRVRVEPDCSIPGYANVFVIGDLAAQTGAEVPGVAQGAIQMGDFVGRVLRDSLRGRADSRPAFTYRDKGSLATIGRARAVADLRGRTFSGFFAWVLWSLIHITFLIGFRNRLLVMVNWAWQWIVQARGARLITGDPTVQVTAPLDLDDEDG